MMGGTGGYLVGFVLAAGVLGWLARKGWDRSIVKMAAAMLIGNAIIYVPGLLWLASFTRQARAGPRCSIGGSGRSSPVTR